MSSPSNSLAKTASYFGIGIGNVLSWAVSIDVAGIAAGITVLSPLAAGAIVLLYSKFTDARLAARVKAIRTEAEVRREIAAADKDSLSNQIEALRKENRILMLRLGAKVEENTGAIGRIVSPDTETSLDMETLQ